MSMRNAITRLMLCFAVLATPAAGAVQAQQSNAPPNALQGFSQNRDQPVSITANALEVLNQQKKATYTGNVHLVQGDTTLRCKTLIVYYDGDQGGGQASGPKSSGPKSSGAAPTGTGNIRYLEAIGQVIVVQKDQTATGEKAVYDMKTNSVTLSTGAGGFVTVTQGPNVVRGPRLVVHLDTGVSHFEGGRIESLFVPGAAKNGDKNSDKNGDAKSGPAADAKATPAPAQRKPRSNNANRNTTSGLY
jgi:lipopolysaccharide export system protein LptA